MALFFRFPFVTYLDHSNTLRHKEQYPYGRKIFLSPGLLSPCTDVLCVVHMNLGTHIAILQGLCVYVFVAIVYSRDPLIHTDWTEHSSLKWVYSQGRSPC